METTLKSGNSNYCQVAVQEVLFSAIIIRKTNTPLPFETPNIGESSSQQQGDPEHKEIPEISESERTQRADEHHQQEHEDRDRDIREADRVLDRGQMIAEAEERLNTIIDSEEAQIKAIEDARRSAGAFGKFHRWLTKSDPYELDIKTCRNTIGAATHGKNLLREAQAETNTNAQADLINQARILSGLGEMNATNFDNPVGMRQVRAGDRAFHEQLLKDEQEAITVSRDVAVSTITTAGTLGGGAAVNVLGKGGHMAATTTLAAMRSGAVIGGTIAAAESTAHNIDDVQRGEKDIKEATTDIAKDTMVGAALGAGLGAAGKKLEKPLKKAGNKFKKLWNRMRGKSIPEPPPPPPLKQVKPPSERKSPEQSPPQQPAQSPQTASPTDIKAEHKAPSVTPKPKAAPSVPSVWKQGDRIQGRALRAADGEELPPLDYKVVGRKTGDP
ncbi:MAG TPA: hypothetical protein VI913_05055, partial [Candidatus Peribacteraceae bacterium]|nr:hypothetical protein [Candidatus Peribacteraceae bacterium]